VGSNRKIADADLHQPLYGLNPARVTF